MKLSRIIIAALAALGICTLTGCQKELEGPLNLSGEILHKVTFNAGWEGETRTVLQEDGHSIYWAPSDKISVFAGDGNEGGYKFVSKNSEPSSSAYFEGEIPESPEYFAVYPYMEHAYYTENALYITIPSKQEAKEGTFPDNTFISVAKSSNKQLYFKNVCGGFKFSVAHDGIRKVRFTNNSGDIIVGESTITIDEGTPAVKFSSSFSNYNYFEITAPGNGYFVPGKYYYAVCAPQEFSKGVTIRYIGDKNEYVYNHTKTFTVNRANFTRVYDKDAGLEPTKIKSYTRVYGDGFIPRDVDRSKITEIRFHTNSTVTTNRFLGGTEYDYQYAPGDIGFYFSLDGTVANYYTSADEYKLISGFCMFDGCTSLKSVNLEVLNTSECQTMNKMFSNCSSLKNLDLSTFDTSCVLEMGCMFMNCDSLATLNVSSFDTHNVVSMVDMFCECKSLESLDLSSFNTSKITCMDGMFYNCSALKSLDISSFDTSNVTEMQAMFYGCNSLESIDISKFNTSKVTNMGLMFYCCTSMKSYDLRSFDTSNVTDMQFMFDSNFALTSLDLSNFNTSNVIKMNSMFNLCLHLTSLDLRNFDTRNVENMSEMFNLCLDLNNLDISRFNTSKVTNMSRIFQACSSLENIDVSSFNTSNVTDMSEMFYGCEKIKTLDLSTFDMTNVKNMYTMFGRCNSIRNLNLSGISLPSLENKSDSFIYFATTSKSCKITCSEALRAIISSDTGINEEYIVWNTGSDGRYTSVDYSADGQVSCFQKATSGNGVNIVFMGDAYSDRLISNGTYDKDMTEAVNDFFDLEPYKSLKGFFNVYEIKAVSQEESFEGVTALDGYFGSDSEVGGSHAKAIKYALKAVPESSIDNTLLVVIMNKEVYAGTTYMFADISSNNDYGCGLAVAYLPKGTSLQEFAGLIQHEAGGHGFAKLADEYYYDEMGAISEDAIAALHSYEKYGWYKNIDVTDNTSAIKWSKFLSDSRYASENLGAYRGGYTYPYGVWRPTENSIMRYNSDGFNAPSREAIYYRVNKLAYGDSWKYDYDTFVEFDNKRSVSTSSIRISTKSVQTAKPTHAPVIINSDWRKLVK